MRYTHEATALTRYFPTKAVVNIPALDFIAKPVLIVQRGKYYSIVFDINPDIPGYKYDNESTNKKRYEIREIKADEEKLR